MKWNIFERLNTLEKELHELREVVRYQGNTIISLQLANIEKEGAKLVKSQADRKLTKTELDAEHRRKYQREWYAKNKAAVFERRKAAKKLKEAQSQGNSKKTYYWKNREKMREYARQYQLKKRAKLQGET